MQNQIEMEARVYRNTATGDALVIAHRAVAFPDLLGLLAEHDQAWADIVGPELRLPVRAKDAPRIVGMLSKVYGGLRPRRGYMGQLVAVSVLSGERLVAPSWRKLASALINAGAVKKIDARELYRLHASGGLLAAEWLVVGL